MLWVADPDAEELTADCRARLSAAHPLAGRHYQEGRGERHRGRIPHGVASDTERRATSRRAHRGASRQSVGVYRCDVSGSRKRRERQPARLALATIVAAQLATLVAPATRAHSKSEAV